MQILTSFWIFSLVKHLGKKSSGMANPGLTLVSCDVIACIIWPGEEGLVCEGAIVNLPPPCGETLLSQVKVRKGEYGGKNQVINCGWA